MAVSIRRIKIWMGEKCCYFIVLSVIYFVFWGYMAGLLSRLFREPRCIIPDEDMEKIVQQEIAEHYPEVQNYLLKSTNKSKEAAYCAWPPLEFEGRRPVNKSVLSWETLEQKFVFMANGHYKPKLCIPYQKVAIILVVYKNPEREKQFQIFINNMLPKLRRQQLEFGIYAVRQQTSDISNRGLLFNIGFQKAMTHMKYDCVIFHDVDVIPEDDRNYYACEYYPRHMAKRIDRNNYKLPHKDWAGGIISMNPEQYTQINGWSNMYIGNHTENEDIYRRIVTHYDLVRTEDKYSYCGSTSNKTELPNKERCWSFEKTGRTWQIDGLNTTSYEKAEILNQKLFTLVDIGVISQKIRNGYMNRIRNITNFDSLPNATLTLNNMACEQLLGRKLDLNTTLKT
ncbi:beta-1,4-galactosyltransferase 4-like [Mytilus edulis]|uniref:beta-1,4-galactosyltransferase 4-like n=1 Tax=Mytilus edulis TaxID=6550 RepID=UPI0039EFBAC6